MKVKAGVAQLEEAAALPASVNPFVCLDVSALCNFARDFWALRNTRQEGLGCSRLLSPFKLALSHVQGSCSGSPCSLQPHFWAKGNYFPGGAGAVTLYSLEKGAARTGQDLENILPTAPKGIERACTDTINDEVWMNEGKSSKDWSCLTPAYHGPLFFRKTKQTKTKQTRGGNG